MSVERLAEIMTGVIASTTSPVSNTKELLSKNYIVIHNVGEEWELYAENSNPSLLDFIGEAVHNN